MSCRKKLYKASTTQIMTPKGMDLSWHMETPGTEESSEESNVENETQSEKLKTIKKLLTLDGHEPLKRTMQVASWVDASDKTRRFHTSKMTEVVSTVLEVVAPNDARLLWKALKESTEINKHYDKVASLESSLLTALIESYKQATHPNTRKQILSVITFKISIHCCPSSPFPAWTRSSSTPCYSRSSPCKMKAQVV